MVNPFKYCSTSKVPEASLVHDFWSADLDTLIKYCQQSDIRLDVKLAEVYFEWLDEYMCYYFKDLSDNDISTDTKGYRW